MCGLIQDFVKETKKSPADNERFHASGGVCPQTVLCEFGSASPARTFVAPRLREATTTLDEIKPELVDIKLKLWITNREGFLWILLLKN